jgi:small GTP-binding protein
MPVFNHAAKTLNIKIVYYGPGLCGKTTILERVNERIPERAGQEMSRLNTETDRTLFFDFKPLDIGDVCGFKTKLSLYTVPGQVFYNSTRKLVLRNVDGVVFVADAQRVCRDMNKESMANLKENLLENKTDIGNVGLVFQWNKMDLVDLLSVAELERDLNPNGWPSFETIATTGVGVFEGLRAITKLAVDRVKAAQAPATALDLSEL